MVIEDGAWYLVAIFKYHQKKKGRRLSMNIFFYGNPGNGITKKIRKVINKLVPKGQIENYHTIKSFSIRLRQFSEESTIALILAINKQELSNILAMQNLLCGIPTILILPDSSDETVSIGHKFRPRYLSYVDSDFNDVSAVLKKMVGGASETK
jgi:hypothetical protein